MHQPEDARSLAVLFIDLDGFKTINDTLGHAADDTVLIEMGRRLSAGRRTTDAADL
jgi:diguanylate cyclase (GGDEF)-like protein